MVGQNTPSFVEIINKYESSVLNKSNNEINAAKIKLFEKKKIPYRFLVAEVHNYDKRVVKRNKKIITNNKYILFNSWYTKNRKSYWFSSHDMWNYMKNNVQCKQFIEIFDYIEKLGKSVRVPQKSETNGETSSETSGDDVENSKSAKRKKQDIDSDNIKESNDQRSKMYDEFYRVLTVAFNTESPPVNSTLYDFKFTRAFVAEGVQIFKNIVRKLESEREQQHKLDDNKCQQKTNVVATAAEATEHHVEQKEKSRKRKQCASNSVKKNRDGQAFGSKQRRVVVDEYAMVSDHVEDSQMSD
ncbi:pp31 [Orgyia leucostigma nucleopolyhedrovirus]|uniref:Pp31 n=1 Tax=Orgyia leucostigma nucleopolyhedrovirus TaxID=490711 RepID=B0FDS4_9ABAC|nr:pp31 [Orgyia leucostigma nucleopolyhedrovirus]ABY65782.1 pp31 [Orgyia leucostigma nucleopolyhedrovirus]